MAELCGCVSLTPCHPKCPCADPYSIAGECFRCKGYEVTEPEPFGKIPIRTEVRVLGPDDPNRPALNFACFEREGVEVYGFAADGSVAKVPLTRREDVQAGTVLAIPALFGGYHRMTVEGPEDGEFIARASEHFTALLAWDVDDRHCWTSPGFVNTRGLTRLTIEGDP